VGIGIRIDRDSATARHSPPLLGEHSEDVLRDVLDYGDAEIERLRRDKII
jgi:crotonobetainyl-CoA:carnitine CoA-transferase CaiB-like acyl-CoA transferase